jgi:hypothetical protein
MRAFFWLVACASLFSSPLAGAATWQTECGTSTELPAPSTDVVGFSLTNANRAGCFNFVNADSTTTSPPVRIETTSAVACFDPDTAGTSTDTSRVKIRWCVAGTKPALNPSQACIDMGGALTGTSTLDGTEGHAEVQNACLRIPPGVFYVEVIAACTTDACSVRFVGEAKQ